jgi:cytochrome c2
MRYHVPMKSELASILFLGTWLLAAPAPPSLHASRQSATDLQIGSQYISYQELLQLPQEKFLSDDSNFPKPAHLSGVSLQDLKKLYGAQGDLVVALCQDGYRSNYSTAYLAAHHPVLVLTVDGKSQADWPKSEDENHVGVDMGPYLIADPGFKPSFKVLSHTDEAQIPFQVVKLEFRSEHQVFGAIAPHGSFAPRSPEEQGYRIAQQNCFRCHNSGAEGGQMAGITFTMIGMMAKSSPDFFAKYVRNPQALNAKSKMAGSPQYDDQTIAALRAYFTTFTTGDQK